MPSTTGGPRWVTSASAYNTITPKPPRPTTPTLDVWNMWKRSGVSKTDRKQKFREYIANVVDEAGRYNGRYADLIYSPTELKAKRERHALFGVVISELIKDDCKNATMLKLLSLITDHRLELLNILRDRGDLGRLVSGENRKWFFCSRGFVIAETNASFYSRAHEQWLSQAAIDQGQFRRSGIMDDWIERGIATRFTASIDAYRIGQWDWVTRPFASESGFNYIERTQAFVTPEVFAELGLSLADSDGNIIGGYHSSKHIVGKIPSKYDKRKLPLLLGLELEMENADPATVDTTTLATEWLKKFAVIELNGKKHRYCATEHDGSLSNGFECVTGYTGLDVHEQALAPLKESPFKGKLNSHNTTTCGLHVHIDRMSITPLHAFKLNLFVNAVENQSLIFAIARRYNHDRYAAMAPKEGDGKIMGDYVRRTRADLISMKGNTARTRREFSMLMRSKYKEVIGRANQNRYQAINFNNTRTLEYRLYRGTLKYETIMSCLEFTRASWLFSYQHSRSEMTIPEFLKFICLPENRQDTKYLREYLTLKGFDTKERSAVTVPKGRLTQKVIESEDAGEALGKPKANKLHQLHGQAA